MNVIGPGYDVMTPEMRRQIFDAEQLRRAFDWLATQIVFLDLRSRERRAKR